MGRPETWTAAAVVVIGIAVAIWLAVERPPLTPGPPAEPAAEVVGLSLPPTARLDPFSSLLADPADGIGADGLACEPRLEVDPQEASWFRAIVLAPCRVAQTVTIRYGPIVFDAEVNAKGYYVAHLPALAGNTDVTATFEGGETLAVPSLMASPHLAVGLSWAGPAVLRLDVDEYGLRLGEDIRGFGGLLRYGAGGDQQSVVYVAPQGAIRGPIRVRVDVRPGKACGDDLAVTAFDTLGDALASRDVTVKLAECGSATARFVLDNMLDDLGVFGPRG